MYSGEPIHRAVQRCKASLSEAGLNVSATVCDSEKAIDLALLKLSRGTAVIRCVERATDADAQALHAMLAQGDFTRAAIVYTAEDQPHLTGEIEAYPISRIDELAASLARESTP